MANLSLFSTFGPAVWEMERFCLTDASIRRNTRKEFNHPYVASPTNYNMRGAT
jgi:hypothetical protein